MQIQGKTILVTGGGSGIGRALVLHLLNSGARVAAADINMEALKQTKKLVKGNQGQLSLHLANIADREAVQKLRAEVVNQLEHVDGIINNAGIIQPFLRLNDLEYEDIERVMHVNFYGTLYMTKEFLPHLLERPEAHIVNVSSMGGFLPVPGQGVYGASKAAVKLLTESLYAELKETNVHVTVVFPGGTDTNIAKHSGIEGLEQANKEAGKSKMPIASPEEVAKKIISAMEKNNIRVHTGKDSALMDLLYRLNPNYAINFIAKRMKSLLD